MADEEEETVKKVIEKLRDYLQKYLSIDENFIRGFQARKLLNERDSSHFCATLSKGGNDALYRFLDHVSAFYVEETLETFCTFLDDYSKSEIRPRLGKIAAKIRAEMKKHQPGSMGQADTQQDGDLVPTVCGELVFSKIRPGQQHQIEDLSEDMLPQFEQMQTSKVLQEQFSTLKGTLCKDHRDTVEKAVEGYQKVAAFLENSELLGGKSSLSIDLCQLAVEKKAEVDSMLEVLQTKQKELQSDEHLYSILKRKKRKAVLKAASKKKKFEISLIKDDTDIELISSDSEEVP